MQGNKAKGMSAVLVKFCPPPPQSKETKQTKEKEWFGGKKKRNLKDKIWTKRTVKKCKWS